MNTNNNAIPDWQKLGPGILTIEISNQDYQNALYISDQQDNRNLLVLNIKNISKNKIQLNKSADAAHLELFFPNGILDAKALPTANQIKITQWHGVANQNLIDMDAIANQPMIDMATLNKKAKMDISPVVEAVQSRAARSVARTRSVSGLQARSISSRSDLTNLIQQSNALKTKTLALLEQMSKNPQINRSPVLQQGMTEFAKLYKSLDALSDHTEKSLQELYELERYISNGLETAQDELYQFIQDEISTSITSYLEEIQHNGIFNSGDKMMMKDVLQGLENVKINPALARGATPQKSNNAQWQTSIQTTSEGVFIKITQANQATLDINTGDYLRIEIPNLQPISRGGTRNANFEVRYPNITIFDDAVPNKQPLHRFGQATIKIENRRGLRYAPLQLSVTRGLTIVNNGKTDNTIILQITNTGQNSIFLQGATLEVTYEVGDTTYALTDKDDEVTVLLSDNKEQPILGAAQSNQFQNEANVGAQPLFILKLDTTKVYELKSGDFWHIELKGIKTDAPSGSANIYISYLNLKEYWDGRLVAKVYRSPMVSRMKNVGFGTKTPQSTVHIKDDNNLLTIEGDTQAITTVKRGTDEAKLGYNKAETDDFTIDNPVGNIQLKTNDQVIINHEVPFQFARFAIHQAFTPTHYSVADWNAAITGWQIDKPLPQNKPRKGSETLRMERNPNGKWQIRAVRTYEEGDQPMQGSVDVMFVSKHISTKFDYR